MSDGDVVSPLPAGPQEADTATIPADTEPGGPAWRWGRRLPGSPERRSRALPVLVAVALLLGVGAGVVARGFVSPAQVAANAKPPRASLITARVRFGVLAVPINIRANVGDGNPVQVGAPSDLGGSLAVVTSLGVSAGQRVGQGQLLLTVAERPVFLFAGPIPAFRTMSPGMRGADVAQLQTGLAAAGFGVGSDVSGTYGPGTAAAVSALYKANGVAPVLAGSRSTVRQRSGQVSAARRALAAAQAKLTADQNSNAPKSVLSADQAAVTRAEHHLSAAERALASAQKATGAQIPMGEVVFVPHLPARILSVDKLGATVGSAGSGSGSGSGAGRSSGKSSSAAVQLGSGKVTLTGFAPGPQARLLRPGMTGTAISDVSGQRFGVRISSVNGPRIGLVPVGRVPGSAVGQNVEVTLTASRVRSFIVPVAAVGTSGSGQTYLTLSVGGGQTRAVPIRLGVSSGGLQAVSPVRPGGLRAGQLVVLGIGSAK